LIIISFLTFSRSLEAKPFEAEFEENIKKLKNRNEHVVELWDNTRGLPQNAIYAMNFDHAGFLWMATEEGLARHDGLEIKVFDKGGYNRMLDQTYYSFFKGKSGIWASSDRSIALLDKTITKVIDCNHIADNSWIMTLSEDDNGYLWIGTQDGNVHLWKNDTFSLLPNWKPEQGTETQSLYHKGDGIMLIGTNNGLYEYNYQKNTHRLLTERNIVARKVQVEGGRIYIAVPEKGVYRVEEDMKLVELVSFEKIKDVGFHTITKDKYNNLWAGSTENGLIRIHSGGVERFYFDEIKNYTIRNIQYDGENLYLGTHGRGLVIVKPAKVQKINHQELREKNVKALFQDSNDNYWIGTKSEGVYKIENGAIKSFNTSNGLLLNWVNTIGEDKNNIYVGSTAGISIIDKKTEKIIGSITEKTGLKSNYVYVVFEDSKETLWILTRYGGLHYREKGGELKRVSLPDKFRNTNFNTIKELQNGELMIGSMNYGAFRIADHEFKENIDLPLKPGENVIYAIHQDSSGDLWFGTHGGIVLYKDGKFSRLTRENGLSSVSVFSITHDGKSGIWISNNFGVQYFPEKELEKFKTSESESFHAASVVYNKSHGMPNSETNGLIFPAAFKDNTGKIWIPTVEGVGIINPMNMELKDNSANFKWDELLLGGEKISIENEGLLIPAGTSSFQISFSNIDFTNPSEFTLYQRIPSKNEQWIPIREQRSIIFSGLRPGNYELQVRVMRNGQLDGIHTLPMEVKAFFFEMIWFRLLVVSLACILAYFIVTYIAKVKVNNTLEKLVQERTLELSSTNDLLKEALTKIESQNYSLKEITWQQSHLVRAPLTKALGLTHLLINYPKYKEVGKSKDQVKKEILETLEQLDKIVRETHNKSESLVNNK
jgi:ligand-binding sensor domain-containing protein